MKAQKAPTFTAYVVKEYVGQIQLEVTITSETANEMLSICKGLTESKRDLYMVTTNDVIRKHNGYIDHMTFHQYSVTNSSITNRNSDVITKINIYISSNDGVTTETEHLYKEDVIGNVLVRLCRSLDINMHTREMFEKFNKGRW